MSTAYEMYGGDDDVPAAAAVRPEIPPDARRGIHFDRWTKEELRNAGCHTWGFAVEITPWEASMTCFRWTLTVRWQVEDHYRG